MKIKSIKSLLAVTLVSSALVSCQKDQFQFTDVARVQFGPVQSLFYDRNAKLADTTKSYTFIYAGNKTSDTVYFDLYATGGVSAQDRNFTLKQVDVAGANNAVADQHFRAFDNELLKKKYVVKAGQVHTMVPVVLLRDPSLKTMEVVLKFEVQENENFKLGETANLWRKVNFSDRLSVTPVWSKTTMKNYVGTWSYVKHKFMIDHTGQPWSEAWINDLIANDYNQLLTWIAVAKTAWVDYNNANPLNKLKDENGVLIVFP
ncbi:DUF4843 domain-containing protein [Solitalea lacus]|uniref:DUF4843 domain-containing protein n=1 Tax=Solitalea lacus TaxID=2911172 RepID=UPI001EDBF6B9|nr:DUF4843 domain-containing protein [Solitalea lacus]UKJ08565.1 DUF4843 domain-containing protein [Solitalea lacus]